MHPSDLEYKIKMIQGQAVILNSCLVTAYTYLVVLVKRNDKFPTDKNKIYVLQSIKSYLA